MSTKIKGNLNVQGDLKLDKETAERAVIIDANNELKSSNVTATELDHVSGVTSSIQGQINMIESEASTHLGLIQDLEALSGVPSESTDLGTFTGDIIPDESTVKGALQSLETFIEALPEPIVYRGTYDASTNTPALSNSDTDVSGYLYRVVVAGTQDFGAGPIEFDIGDSVVNNGTVWEKWDHTDQVQSVNGLTGNVQIDADIVPYDNAVSGLAATDVQAAIDELQGEIGAIPSAPVDSVNGQTGVVVLDSDDITEGVTNQYFTDARAQSAAVVNTLAGSETDQAPSVDAVNNALATKADASDLADYLPIAGGTLTGPLVLDADPTTDDEAANKKYVDDAISGIPVGANTSLSNLTSPTAINQDLRPDSSGVRTLGRPTLRWAAVFSDAFTANGKVIIQTSSEVGGTTPSGSTNGGTIKGDATTSSTDCDLNIVTINKSSSVNSGNIRLESGNTEDGNSGDIILRPGVPTGSGDRGHIDVTSAQIKNVQDPVADQDAATKKYVDDEIAAIPAGANTSLSNLTSPTAINQDLIPSGTRNLGSNGFRFNTGFFQALNVGTGYARVQGGNITLPSLLPGDKAIFTSLGSSPIGVYTDNSPNTSSGPIHLETGNTLNSNSGNIVIRPGIPTGTGTRGHIDVTNAQIKNVLDPVAAQDAATKNYVDNAISGSVVQGDISLTSFAGANDVQVATDITGFAFDPLEVRSFEALVSVAVDATSELYESFRILGVQRSSGWSLSVVGTGDESLVEFSITPAGQMQYVSGDYAGFVSLDIQFRAIVTHI